MNAMGLRSTLAPTTSIPMPRDVADALIGDAPDGVGALIEPLYRAIAAAAHPDCPACSALLPVLSAYVTGRAHPTA